GQEQEYRKKLKEEEARPNRGSDLEVKNRLTEEYGYYEDPGKRIVDYHTQWIDVPAGLFRNAVPKDAKERAEFEAKHGQGGVPAVQVIVKCNSSTQYVGMARTDLYL